jgi:tetratricopeptide (TPR) repeat protein
MAGAALGCLPFSFIIKTFMHRYGSVVFGFLIVSVGSLCVAQSGKPALPGAASVAQHAIKLAESGHCSEALPALKKIINQPGDKDLKRSVGLNGVRCAMTLNQTNTALVFLQVLTHDFPRDPDVLYLAVHAYSDLSTRASQELAENAPGSYQAHELLAESFEMQGKWNDAAKEYQTILKQNPNLPGIHFRLGRVLLSEPNPPPTMAEEAQQQFEAELKIDPTNAGAEYILGELAGQKQQWEEAITHFTRASKLDPGFGAAFVGLGASLVSEKRFADAIPPLETAVKLQPSNPAAHYNLAVAYSRSGHKAEAEREFAIHRQLLQHGSGGSGGEPAAETPPPSPN